MLAVKVLLGVLVFVAIAAFAWSLIKSYAGKAFRGTLSVPQGKTSVGVELFDGTPLKPIRYAMALDTVLSMEEATLTSIYTNEQRTGAGVLYCGSKPIGFIDSSNSFGKALMALANKYPKVVVQAAVMGTDANKRPKVELLVPEAKWFQNALKDEKRSRF